MDKWVIKSVGKQEFTARFFTALSGAVNLEVKKAMVMLLKPKSKEAAVVVPDGTYRDTLTKVTQFENGYGERIGFEFTLQGKGVDGTKVMRSTSPNLSPSGKLADLLRGLLGRDLKPSETDSGVDVEKLIGTECSVLVLTGRGKNGHAYSNVERIFPLAGNLF